MTGPGVFISYRRSDSQGWAGRLFDVLHEELPGYEVFLDIDRMPVGRDFRQVIDETLGHCDAFVVIIGPHWRDAADSTGRSRLDNPADTHRLEIASALTSGVRVFPVLVGGAEMPAPDGLPADVRELSFRNAFELADRGFREHARELARLISPGTSSAAAPLTAAALSLPSPSDRRESQPIVQQIESRSGPTVIQLVGYVLASVWLWLLLIVVVVGAAQSGATVATVVVVPLLLAAGVILVKRTAKAVRARMRGVSPWLP
jgi:hypothetical protein